MNVRLPRLRDIIIAASALLISVAICLPLIWRDLYSQVVLGWRLQRELGFSESSPYTRDPDYFIGAREVVAIGSVQHDSIAHRAGLRQDDVMLDYCHSDRGATALFIDLEKARGQKFCVAVVSLFERGPLEQRKKRQVCFVVPKAR